MGTDRFARHIKGIRNEEILKAALKEFGHRGSTMRIEDVTASVGIGKGTLYRHYDSRLNLLRAALAYGVRELHLRALAARDGSTAASASPDDQGLTAVIASPPMRQLMRAVERIAKSSAAVLITGETGSGKEVIALAGGRPLRSRRTPRLDRGADHRRGEFAAARIGRRRRSAGARRARRLPDPPGLRGEVTARYAGARASHRRRTTPTISGKLTGLWKAAAASSSWT